MAGGTAGGTSKGTEDGRGDARRDEHGDGGRQEGRQEGRARGWRTAEATAGGMEDGRGDGRRDDHRDDGRGGSLMLFRQGADVSKLGDTTNTWNLAKLEVNLQAGIVRQTRILVQEEPQAIAPPPPEAQAAPTRHPKSDAQQKTAPTSATKNIQTQAQC